ncbi:MAG: shikimate kinase [Planctomycetota bacterium]
MTDALHKTLVLIGLRVSGKTTLGKRIAEDLSRSFVDLDDRVAEYFRVDASGEAIETHGLEAFRAAETLCLIKALEEPGIVLSLGGGTPTAPGAADAIRKAPHTVVAYLHARPQTLAARLTAIGSASRPSLTGKDPANEFNEIYAERDPIYADLADEIIDADEWDVNRLAHILKATLESYEASAD